MLSYFGLFVLMAFVSFFFGRLYERLGNGSSVPNAMDLASEVANLRAQLENEMRIRTRLHTELSRLKLNGINSAVDIDPLAATEFGRVDPFS